MNGIQEQQKLEFVQNVNLPIGTENELKKCPKCSIVKLLSDFYIYDSRKNGSSYCKECVLIEGKENKQKRREGIKRQSKKYHSKHKDQLNSKSRKYYHENKEIICIKAHDRYLKNKDQILIKSKVYYAKNKLQFRVRNLKIKYGIDHEIFKKTIKEQKYKCAICNKKICSTKESRIDHCHKTQKTRGILCDSCNKLLGFAFDDIEILENAVKYLANWLSRQSPALINICR